MTLKITSETLLKSYRKRRKKPAYKRDRVNYDFVLFCRVTEMTGTGGTQKVLESKD